MYSVAVVEMHLLMISLWELEKSLSVKAVL